MSNVDKIQMEVQQVLLDSFNSIESQDGEVGYIDAISKDMMMNASIVMDIAGIIKYQADLSDDENVKFVLLAAAVSLVEGVKMTYQRVTGYDVDTMFD